MDRARLLRILVTVAAVVLAVLPAVVVFGLGWLSLGHPGVPSGGVVPRDTTPPEAWVLFALFYLVWMFALMVAVVWTFDRIGHHWHAWDRQPRKEKKHRMRLSAGLGFLAGQERARAEAASRTARASKARGAARASTPRRGIATPGRNGDGTKGS